MLGRGRMSGLELVVLARIWERLGVVAVLITPSPIQYRPCFLPPPALMTFSINLLGVRVEFWTTYLPCHRSVQTDATVDSGVVVGLGRVLRVPVDV